MKTKPRIFEVETTQEFKALIERADFEIRDTVVNSILSNLKSRKKKIHLFSIVCIEENKIFEVTLDKSYFLNTLKHNLPFFEEKELYEKCDEIKKIISELSEVKQPLTSKKTKNK